MPENNTPLSTSTSKTKVCFKCNVEQPLTEFYKHPAMGDGYLGKCKTCAKRDVSANYRENIGYYREYDQRRNSTLKRRARRQEWQRDRRKRTPEKAKARNVLGAAIRDGKIKRQPCNVCGTTNGVQGHHHDYSKPLDVHWLCFVHHRQEHGQMQDHIQYKAA